MKVEDEHSDPLTGLVLLEHLKGGGNSANLQSRTEEEEKRIKQSRVMYLE